MPDYKDKTDLWLLHEYLWVDHNGKRVNEIYNLVRKELQSRGYAINPYGHITGFRYNCRDSELDQSNDDCCTFSDCRKALRLLEEGGDA